MKVWRALAVAFFAAALGACAPKIAPPGPIATSPRLTDAAFITADGLELPVRRWLPAQDPKAVVLAVHGFNDYSKAFDKVPDAPGAGPYLAAQGFAVFAYDQRGFGRAPNTGLWPGRDVMTGDFVDFARALKAQYPALPLYAMGESMGAAVVMTAMTAPAPPPVEGVVLVAPAVWARSTMPALYRGALWVGAHIMPGLKPSGRNLGRMASDNIEMLRDNGQDPLFIKKTRIDTIYGLVGLMDKALEVSSDLKVPTLYLYGAHDQIIPKGATIEAMGDVLETNTEAKAAFYDASWHMMLRDKAAPMVLGDVASFLTDPAAPLPSGAGDAPLARLQAAADDD